MQEMHVKGQLEVFGEGDSIDMFFLFATAQVTGPFGQL